MFLPHGLCGCNKSISLNEKQKGLVFAEILCKLDRLEKTKYIRVLHPLRWPDKALRLHSNNLSSSAGDPAGAQHSSATADKRNAQTCRRGVIHSGLRQNCECNLEASFWQGAGRLDTASKRYLYIFFNNATKDEDRWLCGVVNFGA